MAAPAVTTEGPGWVGNMPVQSVPLHATGLVAKVVETYPLADEDTGWVGIQVEHPPLATIVKAPAGELGLMVVGVATLVVSLLLVG